MYACPGLHLSLSGSFTWIYYLKGVLPIHTLTAWAPLLDFLIYEPTFWLVGLLLFLYLSVWAMNERCKSIFTLTMNDNPKVVQSLSHTIHHGDQSSPLSLICLIKEDQGRQEEEFRNPADESIGGMHNSMAVISTLDRVVHLTHVSKHAKLSRPRASETRIYRTLHQASSLTVMTVLWAAFQRTLYFEGE